jgi:hypothetical protein
MAKVKKAQFGELLKAAGKAVDKYSVKSAAEASKRAAAVAAEKNGWKQMRKLDRFERGIIKTPLSRADKEAAATYRESPAGKLYLRDSEATSKKFEEAAAERIKAYNAKQKQKNGGVAKKKMQAGGVAYKKVNAPMVDPKGAYTKVQQRTLGNMKKGGKVSKKK